MSTYPKSPTETTRGMAYFPRMLDKIRLHARGELTRDYRRNLGRAEAMDGMCCDFLRVNYEELRTRVLEGGTDEEVLVWCFEHGRQLNERDIKVWNCFATKLGWRDFASPFLDKLKGRYGLADRTDLATLADLIDLDEQRRS